MWGYKSKNALYVVVKNREKRVTGGRRQGDRCEATGGRKGDRCEATGALWVAKVWEWMCVSSGFWLLYTLRSSYTLPVRSTLHTEGSECKVTKKS